MPIYVYFPAPSERDLHLVKHYLAFANLRLDSAYMEPVNDPSIPWQDRPRGHLLASRLSQGDDLIVADLATAFLADRVAAVDVLEDLQARGIVLHVVVGQMNGARPVPLILDAPEVWAQLVRTTRDFCLWGQRSRSEAIRAGMARKRVEGRRTTLWPPYGFRWHGSKGHERMIGDAGEWATMAEVVAMRRKGLSWYRIARDLLYRGVRTASGREWSVARVRRVYGAAIIGTVWQVSSCPE